MKSFSQPGTRICPDAGDPALFYTLYTFPIPGIRRCAERVFTAASFPKQYFNLNKKY